MISYINQGISMPNDNSNNQDEPSEQSVYGIQTTQLSSSSIKPLNSRKLKTLFTILGAVGIVLLVAGGTFAYLLINKQNSDDSVVKSDPVALSKLGDSLKSSLEDSASASVLVDKSSNPPFVIQKINDSVWIRVDNNSNVLTFSSKREDAAKNESDYGHVTELLKAKGFSETQTKDGIAVEYSSTKTSTQYLSSETIVCALTNTPEVKNYFLNIDCANKADFAKNTEELKPFADAYASNKENDTQAVLLGKVDIQNSATEGYKNASTTVFRLDNLSDGSTAKFYQTPGSNWHFFMTTKDLSKIKCSDYSTTDLVSAYVGFSCWDESSNSSSFVKKDNPTFEVVPGAIGG